MVKNITRRNFLKGSLAGGITTSLAGQVVAAPAHTRVRGANEDIRVAIVGFHSKGIQHINIFRNLRGVRVVALCDVDRKLLAREAKKFTDVNEKIDTYTDIRRVLDDKNIDAVVNATPDHLHGLHRWYVECSVTHHSQ